METIGNPELESEYIASLILRNSYVSEEWANLKISFSALNKVDILNIEQDIESLEDFLIDSFGLVKDSEVSKFLEGNCKYVYESLAVLENKAHVLQPILKQVYEEKLKESFTNTFNQFESLYNDVTLVPELANSIPEQDPQLAQLQSNYESLFLLQKRCSSIISLYGSSKIKQTILRSYKPSNLQELKNYILQLQQSLPDLKLPGLVIYQLSQIIEALYVNTPLDDLDPFKVDRVLELFTILSYPKKYYNMCEADEIIDPKLGEIFQIIYSQFFSEYLSYFLNEAKSMDYEKTQSMRQCLGLPEDFSDLTTICSSYIKLGYTL
jgi:hypothetical protein